MQSRFKSYIDSVIYFEGITADELAYISNHSILRTYTLNETIFMEGDTADGLWIVQRGRVKIYKLSPEGGEHILHLRGPGKTFNDIAALDGGPNPANAAALSPQTEIWLVPSKAITHVLTQNPQVALNVIRLLANRVRSLVGQIEDLALYSVVVRLARFLIKQLDDPSLSGPGITRTTIAAHLATTPQTISTVLKTLEEMGAIEFNRHEVLIVREDLLRSIAMLA